MSYNISERNSDATIYVGSIDQKVTQEILWELFAQCGIVLNVHLPRDKITGEHQGYGFVEFKTEEDADYSIKIMHLIKLYGKPIKVNKASQDKRTQEVGANVFIGNLDPSVSEKQLFDTFSTFGHIISHRIVRDSDNNQSKGYGFISYDNFEWSDNAIATMNGQYYGSQKISVQYAFKKDSKGERHGSAAERLLAANRPQPLQAAINANAPAPLVPKGNSGGMQRSSIPMAEGMLQPSQIQSNSGNNYPQPPNFPPPMPQYNNMPPMPPNMPPPPMYMQQGMPPQMQQGGYPPLPPNMPPPPMGMPPLPPGQFMPPPPHFMPPMPNMPMPPRHN